MRILVFLGGTTVVDSNLVAPTREEMILRSKERARFGGLSGKTVPIRGAVDKIRRWAEAGAEIIYFSSTRRPDRFEGTKATLTEWKFPVGEVVYRGPTRSYAEVAQELNADIIIEDDCESIGGVREMVYPNMLPEFRSRIHSIVVKEFAGIDDLPDDPNELRKVSGRLS